MRRGLASFIIAGGIVIPAVSSLAQSGGSRLSDPKEWDRYRDEQRAIAEKSKAELQKANERLDHINNYDQRMKDVSRDMAEVVKGGLDAVKDNLTGSKVESYKGAIETANDFGKAYVEMNDIASDQLDAPDVAAETSKLEKAAKQAEDNINTSYTLQQAISNAANSTMQQVEKQKKVEFVLVDQSSVAAKEVAQRREAARQKAAEEARRKAEEEARKKAEDDRRGGGGDRPDRPERPDRPDRPDRPEKPERPERPDRPDPPEKPDRPERPEKPDRPDPPDIDIGGPT